MAKRARPHRQPSARDYPRTARLNQLFHEILAEELEKVDDDRLELVTVMAVEVDADLRHAVVYFNTLGGAEDDEDVLAALDEHRGQLRKALGSQARVKRTPELVFKPDEVARDAARIEGIIRDLNTTDEE